MSAFPTLRSPSTGRRRTSRSISVRCAWRECRSHASDDGGDGDRGDGGDGGHGSHAETQRRREKTFLTSCRCVPFLRLLALQRSPAPPSVSDKIGRLNGEDVTN